MYESHLIFMSIEELNFTNTPNFKITRKSRIFIYRDTFSNDVLSQNKDFPEGKKRTTKKGVIITIIIMAGIVVASFLVYLIP